MATIQQKIEAKGLLLRTAQVPVAITNGAAAGTFVQPAGSVLKRISIDTPTAIPGSPSNTNLRIGSAANGQQYVADVDVKAQGWINATVVYAARNAAASTDTTFHFTVASSGGTTADQDGIVYLYVEYVIID